MSKIFGQRFAEYYKVLQSITNYYRVLQRITEYYREIQSITEYDRVLQSITKYYKDKDKSSVSTWTNFWACLFLKNNNIYFMFD